MHPESIQQFARLLLSLNRQETVGGCLPDADLQVLVGRNRLEPLFYVWGIRPELWRDAYVRNVCRAEPALALGLDIIGRLEQSAIPCLPLRGPFWGVQYWGDPAARTFADLDLLVPPHQADPALKVLERAGFQLRPRGMSARFYRAIHLHYPLVHPETGTFCDLHWAVDHPFRASRIPYDAIFAESTFRNFGTYRWRVAAPVHECLLTGLHFVKELPAMSAESDSTLWARAALSGQLKSLLDLVVCGFTITTPRGGGGGVDVVDRLAGEWRIEPAMARVRTALQGFHEVVLPSGLDLGVSKDSFLGPLGFRRQRLDDVWTYLREGGLWRAGTHLVGAGCVAAACLVTWKIRTLRLRGVG